jgi:hypothetical protein
MIGDAVPRERLCVGMPRLAPAASKLWIGSHTVCSISAPINAFQTNKAFQKG